MIPTFVIGLGRISAGNQGLAGDLPLSHIAAISRVDGLRIAGVADIDEKARERAHCDHDLSGVQMVADWRDLPIGRGSIVAVTTPAGVRAAVIEPLLERRPALLIVEKPLATSSALARKFAAQAEKSGVTLRVNYNRRFDPRHCRWRDARPLSPRRAVVRYGKGLLNYASHVVDLLIDWYGPIREVRAFGPARKFGADDWSLDFGMRMDSGPDVVFLATDGLGYDQLEMDVLADDGLFEWRAGGAAMAWRRPVDGRFYRGYRHLAKNPSRSDEGPVGGFVELYEAAARHVTPGAVMAGCDGACAAQIGAALEGALWSAENGAACVDVRTFHSMIEKAQ